MYFGGWREFEFTYITYKGVYTCVYIPVNMAHLPRAVTSFKHAGYLIIVPDLEVSVCCGFGLGRDSFSAAGCLI